MEPMTMFKLPTRRPRESFVADERADFARIVNEAMEAARLTEHDLCEMFDATVPAVHAWRAGETMPQTAMRRRVIARLEQARSQMRVAAHG
jgi:ribosome-binding protein aMBF1 (putative translation factor)